MIHPRKFAAGEGAKRVRAPDLRRPGWRRLRRSSVGEFDVQMLLKLNGARRAAPAVAGWGGGRFELWRRPAGECQAPCVRADIAWLRLRWDTDGDRAEAEAALEEAFEKGLKARPGRRAGPLRTWSSRGGTIALGGSGRETTVVLAPDPDLAAAAMSQR